MLGYGDRLDSVLLLEQPSKVVTLSQNGTLLRGWHRRDGGLTWERSVSTGASLFPAKLAAAEHRGLPAIAVLTRSALKVGSTLKHPDLAVGLPSDGAIRSLCLVCQGVQIVPDWRQGPVQACQASQCWQAQHLMVHHAGTVACTETRAVQAVAAVWWCWMWSDAGTPWQSSP